MKQLFYTVEEIKKMVWEHSNGTYNVVDMWTENNQMVLQTNNKCNMRIKILLAYK
jgi:hypothetical protein